MAPPASFPRLTVPIAADRRRLRPSRSSSPACAPSWRRPTASPGTCTGRRRWRGGGTSTREAGRGGSPPTRTTRRPGAAVNRPRVAGAGGDSLAFAAAGEPIRAGGHREALGWVLADLHAVRPLALGEDYAALTAVLARSPELAKALVAIASFQPARIEYVPPGSRYV